MASFLSTAASYLGRTTLSTNYTVDTSVPPVVCGNWKVSRAVRNSGTSSPAPASTSASGAASSGRDATADLGAGKGVVSIWEAKLEAKGGARQIVIDMLKKEASSLTRLRHPCVLSVVEPVEETRNALTFATEPIVASLHQAVLSSESAGRASEEVALDEVEIQKGLLQVARGLEFLHSAGMVHGNLDSQSICINAKGDWKMCGFGFLTPLKQPDGTSTPFRHPDYDPSLPPSLSVNFDFLAPEYALDEQRVPANDIYSLGCIIHAVHSRGDPPFRNRNSVANLRSNADLLATMHDRWRRMGGDITDLLDSMLTRYPGGRLTAQSFQKASYFNNILVSTLKFLERESFSGRTKEERVQFLKGLLGVLPQFSDRLLRRKVLPAVLELMSDRSLLPFILPNVFHIAKALSSIEFTSSVLPRLQPLFSVQDPPQNQLMLLDQIELFVAKTSPSVFREGVTPLLYSSLEAENAIVQERALQQVPRLCEVLEYSHVKEVLFPKIAVVFSKTKILSVKVNTLISFHHMIPILDKHTLTEKLVPLLSRIKTREPSVMVATLAVHEALSTKVDRDTLAIHIIPQLWSMSMGPLLNAEQFEKFMKATREMGEKVAKEHLAHLKEVKRMQDHTDQYSSGGGGLNGSQASSMGGLGHEGGGEVDFATLVGSGKDSGARVVRDVATGTAASSSAVFDPFAFDEPSSNGGAGAGSWASTPALTPSHTGSAPVSSHLSRPSLAPTRTNSSSLSGNSSGLAGPLSNPVKSALPAPPSRQISATSSLRLPATAGSSSSPTPPPGWTSGSTLLPSSTNSSAPPLRPTSSTNSSGPNYNISLPPANNFGATSQPVGDAMSSLSLAPASGLPALQPQASTLPPMLSGIGSSAQSGAKPAPPMKANPPGWTGGSSGLLQPTRSSASSTTGRNTASGSSNWGEFDPLA
ncbi:unnamed protein product [Parajaminaea phylloscopi]